MKIISQDQIRRLNISPSTCVEWIKESFSLKSVAQLPAKISLHPQGNDFFNTELTYDKNIHSYVCSACNSHRGQRYVGSYSSIADDLYVFD